MGNPLVTRMAGFNSSVFAEMTQRALQFDAVNLGQGFPDSDPPAALMRIATQSINDGLNQYAPARGMPILREAIAEHRQRFNGIDLDPEREILVTVGATEALTATILALVEPGDEVVVIEPYFDSYAAAIALAGGVRRSVPLHFPDGTWDLDELRGAFSSRTRLVVINSPHNPSGRVFTRQELAQIAAVAVENDVWVVADEVYEHLTFDGARHIPIATLPGMAQRTVSISSGGKTFSATGWKVGWTHGCPEVIDAIAAVKQSLTFVASGPFQPAIAAGLALPESFFAELAADLASKRDTLTTALAETGMEVLPSHGTYFAIADVAPLGVNDAVEFCRALPERVGVVGVPVSAFTDHPDRVATLVRFAFCKQESVLREGARRLRAHASNLAGTLP